MYGFGYSPFASPPTSLLVSESTTLFSPREQLVLERRFANTTEEKRQQRIDGLNDTIERLRLEDGVNAKMVIYSVRRLRDLLDDAIASFDAAFPAGAPHALLLGPQFPRDVREVQIKGKILSVTGAKLTDHQGLFGDSYWESVSPDERLQDHELELLSGSAAGEVRQIIGHVLNGTGAPYIEVDDATGISSGDRFRVREATIPQDNLDKKDRSSDWVITTAIRGSLTSAVAGNVFADVFGSSYWSSANKKLKGRQLVVLTGAYAGSYLIETHNVGGGFITVEGDPPFAGTESFAIQAHSPFENGTQRSGTLRVGDPSVAGRYDTLEPGTKIRMHRRSLNRLEIEERDQIEAELERIDRYLHLRFHRWFGTYRALRRQRRIAVRMQKHFAQDELIHEDVRAVVTNLNLLVDIEE